MKSIKGLPMGSIEQIAFMREIAVDIERQRDWLLDALKEVVAISDRDHDAWNKAKAAIAKAEGTDQ